MFRKMRGVALPETKQGLLFFTCKDYAHQPEDVRRRIRRVCREAAGGAAEDRQALFDLLTSGKSVVALAQCHHMSESKLYAMRRRFYETWYEEAGPLSGPAGAARAERRA